MFFVFFTIFIWRVSIEAEKHHVKREQEGEKFHQRERRNEREKCERVHSLARTHTHIHINI